MATRNILIAKFGVLMSLEDLASVLGRSPEGLRVTIRSNSELGLKLREARSKVGRRVRFRTESIADLIDQGASATPQPLESPARDHLPNKGDP
jgi:hypothetical protein